MKSKFSFYWRLTLSAILAFSCLANTTVRAQDISGGAGVLLASADVEAKLGKGIFSTPKNQAHAPKHFEKKTVVRPARSAAHPQKQTTASSRHELQNLLARLVRQNLGMYLQSLRTSRQSMS
jgi:hypothetical protein